MKHAMPIMLAVCVLLGGVAPAGPEAGLAFAASDSTDRAITIVLPELEQKVGDLEEGAEPQDLVGALSVARGYLELGLMGEADEWYSRVENLEGAELFGDAIFNGRLAMAASSGDPDSLAGILANYGDQVEEPDGELLASAFTSVGRSGNWRAVGDLIRSSLALYGDKLPGDLLFLEGRVLRRENRLIEAVYHFERQLNAMKVPDAVHPTLLEQRPRFLKAAADCSFLLNDRLRARGLYQQLLSEGNPVQREWGRFQIAQIDMLANDYLHAEKSFRAIAGDSLGTLAELWAGSLANHCRRMRDHQQYYVGARPQTKVAMP